MPNCDFNRYPCYCSECNRWENERNEYMNDYSICWKCKNKKIINDNHYCNGCVILKNIEEDENKKIKEIENKKMEEIENKKMEEIEKFLEIKKNKFIEMSDKLEVEFIPLRELKKYKNKYYYYKKIYNLSKIHGRFIDKIELNGEIYFNIQKIKNKWMIDKNRIELFFNMKLENYFIIQNKIDEDNKYYFNRIRPNMARFKIINGVKFLV